MIRCYKNIVFEILIQLLYPFHDRWGNQTFYEVITTATFTNTSTVCCLSFRKVKNTISDNNATLRGWNTHHGRYLDI